MRPAAILLGGVLWCVFLEGCQAATAPTPSDSKAQGSPQAGSPLRHSGTRVLLAVATDCPLRSYGYPYWGWGANGGKCCRRSDNTECVGEWVGGRLTLPGASPLPASPAPPPKPPSPSPSKSPSPPPAKSPSLPPSKSPSPLRTPAPALGDCPLRDYGYPEWGWGANSGRCCRFRNNTDCTGEWVGGRLVLPGASPLPSPALPSPPPASPSPLPPSPSPPPPSPSPPARKAHSPPPPSPPAIGDCPLKAYGYPEWGWGANSGRCCRFRNNTDCTGQWVAGQLVLPSDVSPPPTSPPRSLPRPPPPKSPSPPPPNSPSPPPPKSPSPPPPQSPTPPPPKSPSPPPPKSPSPPPPKSPSPPPPKSPSPPPPKSPSPPPPKSPSPPPPKSPSPPPRKSPSPPPTTPAPSPALPKSSAATGLLIWEGRVSTAAQFADFAPVFKRTSNDHKVVIPDPTGNSTGPVIKAWYPKGSWSPSGDPNGGALFYAWPYTTPYGTWPIGTAARLEYEVYFPTDFPWVKGGKLPGFLGGPPGCSGGADPRGCFSVRLMWREGGAGEAYMYVPKRGLQAPDFCAQRPLTVCDDAAGYSLARGAFHFKRGVWTKIAITVRLNDPGRQNGLVEVAVDGTTRISYDKVLYRQKSDPRLKIDALFFATWFGGSDDSWSPPRDTYTLWRNFRIYRLS